MELTTYIGLSVGNNLVLYADGDDMLLYRPVSSPEDNIHLQADIDGIAHSICFNSTFQKCKAMKITRKKQSARTLSWIWSRTWHMNH